MRTIYLDPVTLYSASELRERFPDAFEQARQRFAKDESNDEPWRDEHRDSLACVLDAIEEAPELPDFHQRDRRGRIRRAMSWLENDILSSYRIRWAPLKQDSERRELAKSGPSYRAGHIKPCPWTGYCVEDALIGRMIEDAREGMSPDDIRRDIEAHSAQLWEQEREHAVSGEGFIDAAEANGWEFTEDGERFDA